MAKAIIMPKFGFTQESAEIVRWLKGEGDAVEVGDPIAEVTTDKVNMEVEATAAGILAGLRYQEGDLVPVTEVIAYVVAPGEAPPAAEATTAAPAAPAAQEERGRIQATPVAEQVAREKGVDLAQVAGSGPGGRVTRGDVERHLEMATPAAAPGRVRAVPAARRAASELGVDLAQVTGSGPSGRVQSDDVRRAAAEAAQASAVPPVVRPAAGSVSDAATVVPLTSVRRTIAERLQRSFQEAPHVYFEADVDAGALEDLRRRGNARLAEGQPRISLTALLVRTAAWALERNPWMNSRLDGDRILLLPAIHVGVAVAVDYGLIVPVVRDVARKTITQIAAEVDDLAARARQNGLRPDDVSGGTFTISNLGMFGVDRFTAILNPPQTGILAVGRVRKQVVPDADDRPVVRPMLTVTLGADHRVVDGAVAARFLGDLREGLEHPEVLSL